MAKHRYIQKPIVIEAVKWKGTNIAEVLDFAGEKVAITGEVLTLTTAIGPVDMVIGKYLVRGEDGELCPYDADVFKKKYEPID